MYCPGCGRETPAEYSGPICPSCGATLPHPEGARSGPAGIPWEDRSRLGFFEALLSTLRLCLADPTRFFSDLPKRENLGSAIQYLLLLTWVGGIGGIVWGNVPRSARPDKRGRYDAVQPPSTARMEPVT